MNTKKEYKITSLASILIGTIQVLLILNSVLFVYYIGCFTYLNWLGYFVYAVLLVIAGILLLASNKISLLLFWIYSYGLFSERIYTFISIDCISIIELIVPIVLMIPFLIFSHRRTVINKLGVPFGNIYIDIILVISINLIIFYFTKLI